MILDVRQLRLVRAVADQGNLTRAGSQLHLSQSALSHQLRDLEAALGIVLFQRARKRMIPTQAGNRLLEIARETLGSLERAEVDLRRFASGREAVLRLSTECHTCYHWLPRALAPFSRQYPSVEVRIDADATRQPLRALLAGHLDLAIVLTRVRDRRVEYLPLFEDELVVLMHPGHPLARKRFIEAADFADQHLMLYAMPREESTLFREVLNPAGVTPRQFSQMQLTESIFELVKSGLGVTVLARWAAEPQLESGRLVARRLTEKGFHRSWYAAVMRSKETPDHVRAFARLIGPGPKLLRAAERAKRGAAA